MSESSVSDGTASSNLVVALVKKACDGLAVLATSLDEINSLKRLTVLLELQKSWESKADHSSQEKHEDGYQQNCKDDIVDIVLCHDCGQSELSSPQKSPPPFICNQCGLGFQKCLVLMRHLLTHNTSNNFNNTGSHSNGVDLGHANNNRSPLAILSQDRSKDFYIFMNPSGAKEAGPDMNVKLESAYGNVYDEDEDDDDEDDEEEDEDDDDEYNDNGDDEDDDYDYSRGSQNQKNSDILCQAQQIRNNMESESPSGLKKEENNNNSNSGQSNESYDNQGKHSSKYQLGSSKYSFFPKLECPACGRHFRRTNSLKNHMAIHTSRGPFYSHAQRNSSSNHGGRYKRSRSPLDKDDRPALCCDCGKQFVNLKRLKIHALSHSAPERFSCNKCPLKFSVAASLKRHLQRHSGIRPHVCSKCGKSFVRSDELTAHERLHSNRNRFPCPVCGKGFTRSIDMVRHQSCHETMKPYQCNQCDKSFVRHDFLKKHESTHLSRACPFCKDVFENRRNITLHIKKEHPDKSVEDLFSISQSKLVVNSEAYGEAQSVASILEPNNLFEVPRNSLQIEFSPLVDDGISTSLANTHQLAGQGLEREEEFS